MTAPVLVIGAGRTGRGFVPLLVGDAPFVLVDRDRALVERLRSAGAYSVRLLDGRDTLRRLVPHLVAWSEDQAWHQVALTAQYAVIAVNGADLPAVAASLAPILRQRTQPLRIVTCVNLAGAAAVLLRALPIDCRQQCRIAEATVLTTSLSLDDDPLDIATQDHLELPCDGAALDDPNCPLPGLRPLPRFGEQLRRKIYTYNGINAVIAYAGHRAGYRLLAEAAADPTIEARARAAARAIDAAICAESGFDPADQAAWSTTALAKFANPLIPDPIARNAADPQRKLGPDDRLIGPARLCLRHDIDPAPLVTAIGDALHYDGEGRSLFERAPLPIVLGDVCGLRADEPLFELILAAEARHAV